MRPGPATHCWKMGQAEYIERETGRCPLHVRSFRPPSRAHLGLKSSSTWARKDMAAPSRTLQPSRVNANARQASQSAWYNEVTGRYRFENQPLVAMGLSARGRLMLPASREKEDIMLGREGACILAGLSSHEEIERSGSKLNVRTTH